jgi:hypothetical protein
MQVITEGPQNISGLLKGKVEKRTVLFKMIVGGFNNLSYPTNLR